MRGVLESPRASALVGLLAALPLLAANAIVGGRIEPLFSIIRPGAHTTPAEYALLTVLLLLLPVGAYIALRPLLGARAERESALSGPRVANWAVAAVLLVAFVAISASLGEEIYRCDVLQIPNCD